MSFHATHTVVQFVLLLPSGGVHQGMLDAPWYPPENAQMDASGPFPRPVLQIFRLEFCLFEADIGFLACTPTIIRCANSITRAKQACEFPRRVVQFVLLLPSGGPSENAQWTLPGIQPINFCCTKKLHFFATFGAFLPGRVSFSPVSTFASLWQSS